MGEPFKIQYVSNTVREGDVLEKVHMTTQLGAASHMLLSSHLLGATALQDALPLLGSFTAIHVTLKYFLYTNNLLVLAVTNVYPVLLSIPQLL